MYCLIRSFTRLSDDEVKNQKETSPSSSLDDTDESDVEEEEEMDDEVIAQFKMKT